jgi:hypothetical protein
MSREDDERELRKLEYLDRRGVATFNDTLKRKDLARKMALEDFEQSEALGGRAREVAAETMRNRMVQISGPANDEKESSN